MGAEIDGVDVREERQCRLEDLHLPSTNMYGESTGVQVEQLNVEHDTTVLRGSYGPHLRGMCVFQQQFSIQHLLCSVLLEIEHGTPQRAPPRQCRDNAQHQAKDRTLYMAGGGWGPILEIDEV